MTPDQQFQAGLYCKRCFRLPRPCRSVRSGLCPASQYGSKFLSVPAAGTENDDHNPPRIASRNLFDIAVGHDNLLHRDRYKLSARLTVVNLTNKEALYNFISTFSGTHYVSPRSVTATLGFHFERSGNSPSLTLGVTVLCSGPLPGATASHLRLLGFGAAAS